ncbi:hypothetical protein POTOM_042499 [Populus tomentosa]|uniref:Ycf20-like protein n=2 Tax=Populus TaxID=3689 RepID=A0A8X8CHG0_POPTO|nr:hypothetical protein POTOM_042499 [Populus tomentosa]
MTAPLYVCMCLFVFLCWKDLIHFKASLANCFCFLLSRICILIDNSTTYYIMAQSVSLITTCPIKLGFAPQRRVSGIKYGTSVFRSSTGLLRIRAVQENEGPRRLIDIIRTIPELSRNYFRRPSRRALFGGISLLGGFYVAQTISLSFGALGVNDVIAAVVCVLLTEYVTRFYYSRPKVTFPIALLNNFKMGFTYGLFIDAFKLAS